VGQLVAEAVRFYGSRFWPSLALGVPPAILAVALAPLDRIERLLERGLVEIAESYDFNPNQPRVLARDEALSVIADPRQWRDLRADPVEPEERYYLVVPTPKGEAAWEGARPDST